MFLNILYLNAYSLLDAQMLAAPLTPILTPPMPLIDSIDSKPKTEISATTKSDLNSELNSLKQSVDNKVSVEANSVQNGDSKTATTAAAADKPLNGFGGSNSSEGSESDSAESSSPSSVSETEEGNDKAGQDKKRKLESDGSESVEQMAVDQSNLDSQQANDTSANKKFCQDVKDENQGKQGECFFNNGR